jgi:uncharacterized membrane protein
MIKLLRKYPVDSALIISFFVLNLLLRLLFAGSREVCMDEPFSIFWAQQDIRSIFNMLQNENNPALHFLLLHGVIKFFGTGAFAVRFLSVLFSSLSVVVIFLIGRRFFSRFTGVAAASVFTLSTMQMYFSHEARVYSLFLLLASLSFYTCMVINSGRHSKWHFVWLFCWNLLLIYSHYFGFFVLLTELFAVLVFRGMRRSLKPVLLVFAMLALCYIPNLIVLYNRFALSVQGTWVKPPEWTELYGNLNRFMNTRYNMLVLIFIFLVTGFFLFRRKKLIPVFRQFVSNRAVLFVLCWFVLPYLMMFLLSFRFPMFIDRYILFTSVPFYIFIVFAIDHFSESKLTKWVALGMLLLSMSFTFQLNPDNKRRVDELVDLVVARKGANGMVIISPEYADLEFVYHYKIEYFHDYRNTRALLHGDNIFPTRDINSIPSQSLKAAERIVFVDCGTQFAFGNNPMLDSLNRHYTNIAHYNVFEIYSVDVFK